MASITNCVLIGFTPTSLVRSGDNSLVWRGLKINSFQHVNGGSKRRFIFDLLKAGSTAGATQLRRYHSSVMHGLRVNEITRGTELKTVYSQ